MEVIEVDARFDTQGKAIPLRMTWKGQTYTFDSIGRRWEDEKGQHILVMIPAGQVYELLFVSGEGRWYLLRAGNQRMLA